MKLLTRISHIVVFSNKWGQLLLTCEHYNFFAITAHNMDMQETV